MMGNDGEMVSIVAMWKKHAVYKLHPVACSYRVTISVDVLRTETDDCILVDQQLISK